MQGGLWRQRVEQQMRLAGHHRSVGRGRPAIGHVRHLDAAHHAEQFAGNNYYRKRIVVDAGHRHDVLEEVDVLLFVERHDYGVRGRDQQERVALLSPIVFCKSRMRHGVRLYPVREGGL